MSLACVALVVTSATCGFAAQDQSPPAPQPAPVASRTASRFVVTYDPAITGSFTGRVYLMTAARGEPRFGPSWFGTMPFFAVDVTNWKPDEPLVFDDSALGYPAPISALQPREYVVQAVMRRNVDSPSIGDAPGNAYSRPAPLRLSAAGVDEPFAAMRINQVVTDRPFRATDRVKLVELRSEVLSRFHGRDISMRAAVILPQGYESEPKRHYPAMYWIGGFGSDHRTAGFMARQWGQTSGEQDSPASIVRIVLDPLCYGGHHVFADSANNGPRGTALVQEFIPHLERTFRLVPSPAARFLSGHSSGGWSSLWLQITYPEFFGGVWSLAPDPVDFRDFQRIDLYAPGANMYVDDQGHRRPLARDHDGQAALWYEDFAKMEVVYGEGGQLRSFEWVFSPRAENGLPAPLYDRRSGAVDPAVAEYWKRYDIGLTLRQNWPKLKPLLAGKINIIVGEADTFFLDGAVKLFQQSLQEIGAADDVVVEVVPGRDHSSILTRALWSRIDREMLALFQRQR